MEKNGCGICYGAGGGHLGPFEGTGGASGGLQHGRLTVCTQVSLGRDRVVIPAMDAVTTV